MNHCLEKVLAIVSNGNDDRRSIFQLGYNLGRLSETPSLGRELVWDRWKGPVQAWDIEKMGELARELLEKIEGL